MIVYCNFTSAISTRHSCSKWMHGIIINSKLFLKRCFKNPNILNSHAQKCFFFLAHTQQRIYSNPTQNINIRDASLLSVGKFSVKNRNHLIRNVDIMGFCAFLLLKSCHCCWGNPFPRSINHKVQQHNNINMWPDNSDWPDGSSSCLSRLFLDPREKYLKLTKRL